MSLIVKKLLLVAAAAASVGCAARFNGAEQALTVAEAHPISVDSQAVTMTIAAADVEAGLSALDAARLKAFADSYLRNGHGFLTVTAPGGGEAAAATVRDALFDHGVPQAQMAEAAYREGAARDVILSYTRFVATPSACGVWEGVRERDYRNMRSPNFGCATQNNLAAMVGDPHDLVEPAEMSDPDAEFRIRGVGRFRKGEVTSSKTDSAVESQVADQ
jgi:pilus assembly protein CpaD